MSEQTNEQELDMLKAQADTLGIEYHPNIGYDKLRERVKEVMDNQEEKQRPAKDETSKERKARRHREAMALVRCLIVCNDPNKREWPGEWLGVSNGAGVSIRKLVPYNQPDKPFHLPRIMVNMLREKQVQLFVQKPGKYGTPVRVAKTINAYTITELPPLSQKELDDLAKSQLMRGALDDNQPGEF